MEWESLVNCSTFLIFWSTNLFPKKILSIRVIGIIPTMSAKSTIFPLLAKGSGKRISALKRVVLTLFYMGGGVKSTPPGWLLYANPRGMPRMDWFFMTLFLSILERSWVGHFWDFFLKFPKNFTSTIFSTYNPKGGPFYTSKNASIFGSFLGSKMVMIQLQMHK